MIFIFLPISFKCCISFMKRFLIFSSICCISSPFLHNFVFCLLYLSGFLFNIWILCWFGILLVSLYTQLHNVYNISTCTCYLCLEKDMAPLFIFFFVITYFPLPYPSLIPMSTFIALISCFHPFLSFGSLFFSGGVFFHYMNYLPSNYFFWVQ